MNIAEASACKLYCAQAAMKKVALEAVQRSAVTATCRVSGRAAVPRRQGAQIYGGTEEIQISQIGAACSVNAQLPGSRARGGEALLRGFEAALLAWPALSSDGPPRALRASDPPARSHHCALNVGLELEVAEPARAAGVLERAVRGTVDAGCQRLSRASTRASLPAGRGLRQLPLALLSMRIASSGRPSAT